MVDPIKSEGLLGNTVFWSHRPMQPILKDNLGQNQQQFENNISTVSHQGEQWTPYILFPPFWIWFDMLVEFYLAWKSFFRKWRKNIESVGQTRNTRNYPSFSLECVHVASTILPQGLPSYMYLPSPCFFTVVLQATEIQTCFAMTGSLPRAFRLVFFTRFDATPVRPLPDWGISDVAVFAPLASISQCKSMTQHI